MNLPTLIGYSCPWVVAFEGFGRSCHGGPKPLLLCQTVVKRIDHLFKQVCLGFSSNC